MRWMKLALAAAISLALLGEGNADERRVFDWQDQQSYFTEGVYLRHQPDARADLRLVISEMRYEEVNGRQIAVRASDWMEIRPLLAPRPEGRYVKIVMRDQVQFWWDEESGTIRTPNVASGQVSYWYSHDNDSVVGPTDTLYVEHDYGPAPDAANGTKSALERDFDHVICWYLEQDDWEVACATLDASNREFGTRYYRRVEAISG